MSCASLIRPRPALIALLAGGVAGNCATSARSQPVQSPAPSPATAHPLTTPPFRCGPDDAEWEKWFGDVFGRGYEVFHDGPDPTRLQKLTGKSKALAESMLRRGIQACSVFAAEAIEGAGWRTLIPDLKKAVAAPDWDFRVHVVLALKELGSTDDLTADLIACLGAPSTDARMTAAMGARRFALDRLRAPLLDRVRRDPSYLVRIHAAESLLDLADIYPPDLEGHPAIFSALVDARDAKSPPLLRVFGLERPPTPDEIARHGRAADLLDAAITERLAAGPCPKSTPLKTIDLYTLPVNDHIVALTVEESVGPCERTLAFVVFLQSANGFDRWMAAGTSGRDPLDTSIATLPKPISLKYSRAGNTLRVGSVDLDAAKGNVLVLAIGSNGVTVRHQSKQSLSFRRSGRAGSEPIPLLRFRSEVAAAVRALLDRSPDLRDLVSGGP